MDQNNQLSETPIRKYKLEALLNNCTYLERQKALNELPKLIGKCRNTCNNYITMPYGSKKSIPYEAGIIFERYFKIEPGTLSNMPIAC